jgi:betaine-aldehyde dehydrogenase
MAITDNITGKLLIDGEDVDAAATRAVHDPATGEQIADVADASAADAERAVAAARAAFKRGDWSRITPGERAAVIDRMADLLEERADEFARTESRNTGKPLKFSSAFDVPLSIDNLRFFAAAARNLEGKASGEYLEGYTSVIRREPIGVCASIAPWNYPLNMACWKVGPALAAGNAVVLKPSELTPLTALMLGRLALEAGLPPGILNVIPGPGPEAGAALARHPDVALISVTGSTRTGTAVMRAAAEPVKRVHMELGGKAPFVVFEDADLEAAAEGAIVGAFANCGQDCTAATRLYVHESARDEFLERLLAKVDALTVGDPLDPRTDLGPLVSPAQRDRVHGFVERALQDGATAARRRAARPARRLLRANRRDRCAAVVGDRPAGGLRARRLGARLHERRRGLRARQRHALRPRRLGLDARRLPRPARRPRARGRYGLDQ